MPKKTQHKWTPYEDAWLREHVASQSREELATALGVTIEAIKDRRYRLGISRQRRTHHGWTAEQEEWVRSHAGKIPRADMAVALGVTVKALEHRLGILDITNQIRKRWSESEDDYLNTNYSYLDKDELANTLGINWNQVQSRAIRLGLTRGGRQKVLQVARQLEAIVPTEWAYLAGLIDGDGHLAIINARQKKGRVLTPQVGIANSSPEIIQWLRERVGFMSFFYEAPVQQIVPRRPVWRVRLTGMHILPVLQQLMPYLVAKRHRAELIEELILGRQNRWGQPYTERENEIAILVKQINSNRTTSRAFSR